MTQKKHTCSFNCKCKRNGIKFPKRKLIESELKESIWAIVTVDKVIVSSKTYQQCEQLISSIDDSGAAIVTNETAIRLKSNG